MSLVEVRLRGCCDAHQPCGIALPSSPLMVHFRNLEHNPFDDARLPAPQSQQRTHLPGRQLSRQAAHRLSHRALLRAPLASPGRDLTDAAAGPSAMVACPQERDAGFGRCEISENEISGTDLRARAVLRLKKESRIQDPPVRLPGDQRRHRRHLGDHRRDRNHCRGALTPVLHVTLSKHC